MQGATSPPIPSNTRGVHISYPLASSKWVRDSQIPEIIESPLGQDQWLLLRV